MKLTPVDGDPFVEQIETMGYRKLTPVVGDPFAPPKPNQAAMDPEANIGPFTLKGETSGGFNPAAMTIKAGHALSRLNEGVLQARHAPGEWLADKLGLPNAGFSQKIAESQKAVEQPMKDLQEVHPGSTVIGDLLPAAAVPWRALPAIAAAEYGSPGERVGRGALAYAGNKAGEFAGRALGRVAQPTRAHELSETQKLANEAADRLGVKLSAGEASGNRALKWAESTSADLPIASGMATKRHTANARAMNAGVLRQLGQSGDEVTEAVLAKARQDISGEYDRILTPAKIQLDNSFRAEAKMITSSKVMKQLRDEETDALIGQFQNMPQGKINVSGEWFQQNKTALDASVRAAYNNGQPAKARALEQFEEALDRAAMRSLPKADQDAYKTAQRQWSTLRMLETGKVVDGGNVMPGRLNQAMETRYKGAYKEGKIRGELADVARLGNTLRSPPNSGTAPRAVYSGIAGGAAMFEPMTAATMFAGPAAIQGLLTSPVMRKYMERGLVNITPEMEQMLLSAGGRAGGLGGLLAP